MKLVCKNVLWDKRESYFFPIPEFMTYYGEKLPTPKWVESDAICISAGEIPSKMRIIPRSMIVSIDDEAQAPVAVSAIKTLIVQGDKGKSYVVTINGKLKTCTCTGYSFRRTCLHVIAAS